MFLSPQGFFLLFFCSHTLYLPVPTLSLILAVDNMFSISTVLSFQILYEWNPTVLWGLALFTWHDSQGMHRGCHKSSIDSLLFIAKWHSMVWLQWGLFNHHLFKGTSIVSFLGCCEQTLTNICIWVFVWPWLFSSPAQRRKCAITGSYGSSSFDQTTIRKKPKLPFSVYTPFYVHTSSLLTSSPYILWVLLLIWLAIFISV